MKKAIAGYFALAMGVCGLIAGTIQPAHAITVYTTDFIANENRTHFNGFEAIPNNGIIYTGGSGPYTEGGITVQQINGDPGNDIWVTYNNWGPEGNFSWYANGGDMGYTKVTLADNSDFGSLGFLAGSGYYPIEATFYYELLNNGNVVFTGYSKFLSGYLGFSDGEFDELRIIATFTNSPFIHVGSGYSQAFAFDSIEVGGGNPVPEPSTMLLLGSGFLGLVGLNRRRKA